MDRETDGVMLGAQIFFWSRLAYLGLYLTATPWLRSLTWSVGLIGILAMAWPLAAA